LLFLPRHPIVYACCT
jgi:hypothetical protein